MESFWQIIYIGGLSIVLFLFIVIISKSQKTSADKILSAWFFFAFIHLSFIAWYASGHANKNPHLMIWQLPLPFLHGPFLYLYILFLSDQQRYGRGYFLHFVPAIFVAGILGYILPDIFVEGQIGLSIRPKYTLLFQIVVAAISLSGVVYVLSSLWLLKKHRRNISLQLSNTDKITLNWIRYLIAGMSVIWIVVIFAESPKALYMVVALFIFFIGYFGIRQVGVFSNVLPVHEVFSPIVFTDDYDSIATTGTIAATDSDKIKYQKNRIEDAELTRIQLELNALMKEQKCYKDPELTLGDLAKILDVHPVILSQVINSKEEKSFYDYVNTFRVEAFKAILTRPESRQFTLLALAFECGFNSKTSFNRNFKKITEMSPSVYAKKQQVTLKLEE